MKCAILAHRGVLFEQWVESIQKFTTAKISMVKTDGLITEDADFYIFNTAFVHKQRVGNGWGQQKLGVYKDMFGVVIVDEAHCACAEEMSKALLYFNPKIMIGLTATPVRKDGMDKLLELYFGKYDETRIIRISKAPFKVYKVQTGIRPDWTLNTVGKKDWNSVIKSLIENDARNKLIVEIIHANINYNIMVLTKRKTHCKLLADMLKKLGITSTIMVGQDSKYDKTAQVLLSTYSKLGTGFDDSRLNMLIIACSVVEVEQYAGRLRDAEGKNRVIYDLVDDDYNCQAHWRSRKKWYTSRNGVVTNYTCVQTQSQQKKVDADVGDSISEKRVVKRLCKKID